MPEEVVHRQLDAYNDRDLNRFVQFWAEDVEVFEHPDTLLFSGLDALRERHAERFREPDLHAQVLHRRVIDQFVIDQELVTRNFPDGLGTLEVAAIYEVQNSKIRRAWYIFGQPRLNGRE